MASPITITFRDDVLAISLRAEKSYGPRPVVTCIVTPLETPAGMAEGTEMLLPAA